MFGDKLTTVDAVDIRTDNPQATIVADLCEVGSLPAEAFDCQLITQTIHLVADMSAAMANLYQALAPGGSLLLTGPAASPSSSNEPTDAWRFLPLGLELLARECVDDDALVETFGYGNRTSAVAFLMGLSREDLRDKDLEPYDPLCPLIAALRVTKAG
jgi:SAM-dependent methyltransferase